MRFFALICVCLFLPLPSFAACGGNFISFVNSLEDEAQSIGYQPDLTQRFFANVRQDPKVLKADRAQGVFQKPFVEFSRRLISQQRLNKGRDLGQRYDSVFKRIEQEYGVDRGVLLAFWAFETDYGAFQGNFNTLNALITLSHDCRRPDLFRPQVFAALELFRRGEFDPQRTTGAWAGEIGMVQMLPGDILENGVDGDGDGHVRLKSSATDALVSAGKMLQHFGWSRNQPWLQEVRVPDTMDWSNSGLATQMHTQDWAQLGITPRSGQLPDLPASLILPQGHKGPAFLAYPNFRVYFEWNQSFTYVLTAAYFATRIEGANRYDERQPDTGLSGDQMKQLQRKLKSMGHDVGKIDGILGARTRAAVQIEQAKRGMPADAWPTPDFLKRL
ncbi:MAG: lytic murein transglycosylase [Paracoccaceae bacterium]